MCLENVRHQEEPGVQCISITRSEDFIQVLSSLGTVDIIFIPSVKHVFSAKLLIYEDNRSLSGGPASSVVPCCSVQLPLKNVGASCQAHGASFQQFGGKRVREQPPGSHHLGF